MGGFIYFIFWSLLVQVLLRLVVVVLATSTCDVGNISLVRGHAPSIDIATWAKYYYCLGAATCLVKPANWSPGHLN